MPLPEYLTSFVGRNREIGEIDILLDGGGHRLVTLLGPGGIGKTRLAVEAGRRIGTRLAGGAVFVDLAKVATSDEVPDAIALAVGVHAEGAASPVQLVAARLTSPCLLVVDNFEHVEEARPAMRELLTTAPQLRCLATSRSPLRLQGERLFPVEPLATDGDQSAAVELFYDRAASFGAHPARDGADAGAVATICRRVDGLPLAIELVAARLRLFGVQEIAVRLGESLDAIGTGPADLPERQRTISATIEWSLREVSTEQRSLFARLSIFPGGATLEQLEHVCADHGDLLGDLAVLVDNSLVTVKRDQPGGTRYGQLVPLREYATGLLGSEQDTAMDRLVDYYVAAAPDLGRALEFGRQAEKALNVDHNNLLAAMRWSLTHGRIDAMATVLEHLWLYWFNGDLAKSAAEWVSEATDHSDGRRVAWLRGFFGFQVGETGAEDALRSAIEQLDPDEDEYRLAIARAFLGVVTDPEEGRDLLEAASAVVDSDEYGLSRFAVDMFVSVNAVARGDTAAAIATRRRLLELAPSLGHEMMVAYAHQNLATAFIAVGDLESARHHNRTALDVVVAEHTIEGIASVADVEAVLDYAAGHRRRALCILGSAEERYATLRTSRWPEAAYLVQSVLDRAAEEMEPDDYTAAMSEGARTSLDDLVALLEAFPA